MLELRPNCEYCDRDLAPTAEDARICTYECTFCAVCVEHRLRNVCPNCGGGFAPRPIRPSREHRPGMSVHHHPPVEKRTHLRYTSEELELYVAAIEATPPAQR